MEHKLPTTYDRQIDILRSRGIAIDDEAFCMQVLADVNYYRLTAYFLPFKQADGNYVADTSFHRVYQIYEFDRKLRGIWRSRSCSSYSFSKAHRAVVTSRSSHWVKVQFSGLNL